MSPALLSVLYSNEVNGHKVNDLRILAIGAHNELPSKIDRSTGLLDWGIRLLTLAHPAKMHTHDYFLNMILKSRS